MSTINITATTTETAVTASSTAINVSAASTTTTIAPTVALAGYNAGTGLTLSGTTFNVDAAQTGITSLGTLSGLTTGATTVNGALAVNNTTQSITDTTTNSTSVYGPTLELYRNGGDGDAGSTSIVQSDKLGTIDFYGNNDAGTPEKIKYAKIFSTIYEETDGAESGRLSFSVINAGTLTEGANPASILDLEPDVAQFNSTVRLKASASGGVQATSTPILELFQEDGPAADDGDHLGEIQFTAYNDNGFSPVKHKYAGIHAEIIDESNATEDGSLHFTVVTAGTEDTTVLTLNGTESTLTSPLVVTGGLTASQAIANAVTDTNISVSEFATYDGKKIIYTGGAGSVHLADAVAADIGKAWTIINAGTGAITVNRATSSQTLKLLNGSSVSAGSANLTVATGGIIEIICTAADNYIAFGSGIS